MPSLGGDSRLPGDRAALAGLSRDELIHSLAEQGLPSYRADQIMAWFYRRGIVEFAAMTDLPEAVREQLSQSYHPRTLSLARAQGSRDSTRKFLFRLNDGRFIETVLIPASPALYGEPSDRFTLCVSSQVGCAFDCKFCASGLAGFTRNLEVSEIVEQILLAQEAGQQRVNNLVFMGMGEPLANFANLMRAIQIINAPWGIGIGARRITISTSGLAPMIRRLADQPLQLRLAVSLHGASDEVRERIMPINRRYPLAELMDSLRYFRQRKQQKITFEFILIEGINDSLAQAALLAEKARELSAKVNLIPYNKVDGLEWRRPAANRQQAFLNVLRRAGVPATLRREKGHDIDAACGQLRLKEEQGASQLS